jgi:hypothetical protein
MTATSFLVDDMMAVFWEQLNRCVPTAIFHIPLRITSIDMRNITTFENLCFLEITLSRFGNAAQRACAIL